jgi:hypothetical protein
MKELDIFNTLDKIIEYQIVSTIWKYWMKEDLLKDFISIHQKVGEEVHHMNDGGANSELNLPAGRV